MNKSPKVPARSWKSIDAIASNSNKLLFTEQEFFSKNAMFNLFENGNLKLIGINDYGVEELPYGEEAHFIPKTNSLIISESTYLDLEKNVPRASFTLAHEIGHKVLHDPYFKEVIVGKRGLTMLHRQDIPAYQDPECQANQFASAFLMPIEKVIYDLQKGLSTFELAEKYHVSFDVASYRKKYVEKKYAIIPNETPGIAAKIIARRQLWMELV